MVTTRRAWGFGAASEVGKQNCPAVARNQPVSGWRVVFVRAYQYRIMHCSGERTSTELCYLEAHLVRYLERKKYCYQLRYCRFEINIHLAFSRDGIRGDGTLVQWVMSSATPTEV